MGLFGSPNIKRMYENRNYYGLIKAMDDANSDVSQNAVNALKNLVNSEGEKVHRRILWKNYEFESMLKKLEKKGSNRKEKVSDLLRVLNEDLKFLNDLMENWNKKNVFIQFEKNFDIKLISFPFEFRRKLAVFLDENDKFICAVKIQSSGALHAGIIATKKKLLFFGLFGLMGIRHQVVCIKFNDIEDIKFSQFNQTLKIIGKNEEWIKIPTYKKAETAKLISFIEDSVSDKNIEFPRIEFQ